jgi:hypothetical protein
MSPDLTLISTPRIGLETFRHVLQEAHSPAAIEATVCYANIVRHGVDPAIGLAFFQHESTFGTVGAAVKTRNWGNLRKGQGRQTGIVGGFASYAHWNDGADDWAALIAAYYVGRLGLATVRQALAVYAPSSDGNRPAAYADAVIAAVQRWQAQAVDVWQAWGGAYPLPEAERGFAIPAAWLADGGRLGAAVSDEIPVLIGAARLFAGGAIIWRRESNTTKVYR